MKTRFISRRTRQNGKSGSRARCGQEGRKSEDPRAPEASHLARAPVPTLHTPQFMGRVPSRVQTPSTWTWESPTMSPSEFGLKDSLQRQPSDPPRTTQKRSGTDRLFHHSQYLHTRLLCLSPRITELQGPQRSPSPGVQTPVWEINLLNRE